MISIGDGVAIAGVCGVLITAIVRWTSNRPQPAANGYVRATTFKAVHDGLQIQLSDIKGDISTVFGELKDINDYIRGLK